MSRTLLYRGPGDALLDCWTVSGKISAVRQAIATAEQTFDMVDAPTARVADLSVAADYMRWVDSEHGLEDSGTIAASDYERVLSA